MAVSQKRRVRAESEIFQQLNMNFLGKVNSVVVSHPNYAKRQPVEGTCLPPVFSHLRSLYPAPEGVSG
eukprot:6969991-Heterocapsa_arctica.AAC.1